MKLRIDTGIEYVATDGLKAATADPSKREGCITHTKMLTDTIAVHNATCKLPARYIQMPSVAECFGCVNVMDLAARYPLDVEENRRLISAALQANLVLVRAGGKLSVAERVPVVASEGLTAGKTSPWQVMSRREAEMVYGALTYAVSPIGWKRKPRTISLFTEWLNGRLGARHMAEGIMSAPLADALTNGKLNTWPAQRRQTFTGQTVQLRGLGGRRRLRAVAVWGAVRLMISRGVVPTCLGPIGLSEATSTSIERGDPRHRPAERRGQFFA